MPANAGDEVSVQYTGTLDDGSIFDSSEKQGKPIQFTVGQGQVIAGFEKAIVGMEVGQEKNITITPDEAYGRRRQDLVQKMPKEKVSIGQEPKKGMMLMVGLPGKQQFPATIADVDNETVTLDMNHPLAEKNLHFRLRLVDIHKPSGQ